MTNRQLIVTYRETNAKSTKSTTTYEYEYVLAAVVTKIDPKHLPPIWPIRGLGVAYRLQYAGPEVRLGSRRVVWEPGLG